MNTYEQISDVLSGYYYEFLYDHNFGTKAFDQCKRVLQEQLFCSRPRPRLVLISFVFQDQYQDKSWNETFLRSIPRGVLLLHFSQDQYQD